MNQEIFSIPNMACGLRTKAMHCSRWTKMRQQYWIDLNNAMKQ